MPSRDPISSTTRLFLLCIICWIISSTTITGATGFDFDCRRTSVNCGDQGGECDVSNGQCDCDQVEGFEPNYRCQDKTQFPCDQNKYGDGCVLDRVQVVCREEKMFVNINPEEAFAGSIYVYGKEGFEGCQLQSKTVSPIPDYVDNKELVSGFNLELSYTDETCDAAIKTEETVEGDSLITYSRDYFIQYNNLYKSNLDQKVTVKCILKDGATDVNSQVEGIVQGNGGFKDVDVETNADLDIITFSIMGADDQPLPASVNLGDEIKLVFTLSQDTSYVDFSLTSCSANNTIDDVNSADYKFVEFVQENCPSADGQALFRDGILKEASTITVSISAFMFAGSTSKVGFECDVKLCTEENKEDCKKDPCDGITSEVDKLAQAQTTAAPVGGGEINATTPGSGEGSDNATTAGDMTANVTQPEGGGDALNETTAETAPEEPDTSEAPEDQAGDGGGNETTQQGSQDGPEPGGDPTDGGRRRRRRRAASTSVEAPVKVYFDMAVQDPTAIAEEEPAIVVQEEKDCMEEPEVITVIAILSVMVLTLALVTLVVVCHAIRAGRRRHSNQKGFPDETGGSVNSSYSGSTSSIGGNYGSELRARVDPARGFSIPRLEIRPQNKSTNFTTT